MDQSYIIPVYLGNQIENMASIRGYKFESALVYNHIQLSISQNQQKWEKREAIQTSQHHQRSH